MTWGLFLVCVCLMLQIAGRNASLHIGKATSVSRVYIHAPLYIVPFPDIHAQTLHIHKTLISPGVLKR